MATNLLEVFKSVEEGFRAKGRIDALRLQLVIKFGNLDEDCEARLQDAPPETLDRYIQRVLTADSLAGVFEDQPPRTARQPRSRGSGAVRQPAQPRRGRE